MADMEDMFFFATSFNQPVGSWNVSQVIDIKAILSDGAFEPCVKASMARSWAGWLGTHPADASATCPSCSLHLRHRCPSTNVELVCMAEVCVPGGADDGARQHGRKQTCESGYVGRA